MLLELILKQNNTLLKPFRLENYWCGHPEFSTIVKDSWHNINFINASIIFKDRITNWKNETFGNIFKKKNKLLARLNGI